MSDTPAAPMTSEEEQLRAAIDALVLAVEASGDPPLPTGFEGNVLRNLYNLGFMVVPRAARSTPAEALDVERLGQVIYEMGIDDLDLPDAQKLAAHILARLSPHNREAGE